MRKYEFCVYFEGLFQNVAVNTEENHMRWGSH